MVDTSSEALIERVYDLALDPEQWPTLLGELASGFGGHAASLEQEYIVAPQGTGFVVGLDPAIVRQYFDYFAERNILRRVAHFGEALKTFEPIVTVDEETMSKSALMGTEFYADFLRPAGIHSVMTFGLWSRGDSVTALTIHRPTSRSSFDSSSKALAERVLPHLVRAFRLSRRVAEGGRMPADLAAALDQSPHGMIVVSGGKVRHANAMARTLFAEPGGLSVLGGALVAGDVADTDRLRCLIARAQARGGRAGGAMTVRRPGGRAPLSLVTSPLGPDTLAILRGEPAALVCITDPGHVTISETYLREESGLTAAEARLARLLVDGKTLRRAAAELDVGYSTVRSQLLGIFEKTGTSRQAELVAMLMRRQTAQAG